MPVGLTINDGLLNPFDQTTEESVYLSPEKTDNIDTFADDSVSGGISIQIEVMLSDEMAMQSRTRYNYWDALGDIGGFHDGLVLLVNVFMASYSAGMFEQSLVDGSRYYKR